MSAISHIRAITLLPGVVLIVVPGIILYSAGKINFAWGQQPPLNVLILALGSASIASGLFLMVKTISLFANVGKGTLAPWQPPKKLVIKGIYRYVRNPMISGVLFILCGESLIFGSTAILTWFLFFLLANLTYIPIVEEPGLDKRFGEDYALYKKNVPRWIPRLHPWEPPGLQEGFHQ